MTDRDDPQLTVDIEEIITHDAYSDYTYENDVMLLRLANPVEFNDHVAPICLPDPEDYQPGQGCYTTGWGNTECTYFNQKRYIII